MVGSGYGNDGRPSCRARFERAWAPKTVRIRTGTLETCPTLGEFLPLHDLPVQSGIGRVGHIYRIGRILPMVSHRGGGGLHADVRRVGRAELRLQPDRKVRRTSNTRIVLDI